MNTEPSVALPQAFVGQELTRTLAHVEQRLPGSAKDECLALIEGLDAGRAALSATVQLKKIVGQINVVIHALGILHCLPHLLMPDECVEYVSLGAGNTGRKFDLETNRRVAEFKFIRWRGGAESIRQNSLFKDFLLLAESDSTKLKYLYVAGTAQPLRFLNGGRSLGSVLRRDAPTRDFFSGRFGEQYARVRDY